MKKIAWYIPDGTVKISNPSRQPKETELQALNRFCSRKVKTEPEFANYEYDYIDEDDLPDRKPRQKWRGKKGEGIYIDHSIVTISEKRQAIKDEFDAELTQTNPDLVKAMKLQQKLQNRDY